MIIKYDVKREAIKSFTTDKLLKRNMLKRKISRLKELDLSKVFLH